MGLPLYARRRVVERDRGSQAGNEQFALEGQFLGQIGVKIASCPVRVIFTLQCRPKYCGLSIVLRWKNFDLNSNA